MEYIAEFYVHGHAHMYTRAHIQAPIRNTQTLLLPTLSLYIHAIHGRSREISSKSTFFYAAKFVRDTFKLFRLNLCEYY